MDSFNVLKWYIWNPIQRSREGGRLVRYLLLQSNAESLLLGRHTERDFRTENTHGAARQPLHDVTRLCVDYVPACDLPGGDP